MSIADLAFYALSLIHIFLGPLDDRGLIDGTGTHNRLRPRSEVFPAV